MSSYTGRFGRHHPQRSDRVPRGPGFNLAGLFLAGAGGIHLAVAPGHLAEVRAFGYFFYVAGAVQVLLALALFARPTRRPLRLALGVNLSLAALWALSRTIGLPLGPVHWQPLATGFSDRIVAGMEFVSALLWVIILMRFRPGQVRRWLVAPTVVPSVLLSAGLTVAGIMGQSSDVRWPEVSGPLPAGQMTSLTYCAPGGVPLAMDVFEPSPEAVRPAPAVLYVHGGGWVMGSRKAQGVGGTLAGNDRALLPELRTALTARGFVVASIDYRLASRYAWPAPIVDAKCAVRFMRAHAGELGIDPGRIGAWGSSAGGNLVALLATAGPEAGFDVGEYPGVSSRLQAAVDMFGPADLTQTDDSDAFSRMIIQLVLGNSKARRRAASPITYVAAGDPPFLILHGSLDPTMPPRQSRVLAQRLEAVGTPVELIMVQGAGHGLDTPGEEPSAEELVDRVTGFFVQTLGERSSGAQTSGVDHSYRAW